MLESRAKEAIFPTKQPWLYHLLFGACVQMWRDNSPRSHRQQGILGILCAHLTSFWSTLVFFAAYSSLQYLHLLGLCWVLLSLLWDFFHFKDFAIFLLGVSRYNIFNLANHGHVHIIFPETIPFTLSSAGENTQKWGHQGGEHVNIWSVIVMWLLMPTVGMVALK